MEGNYRTRRPWLACGQVSDKASTPGPRALRASGLALRVRTAPTPDTLVPYLPSHPQAASLPSEGPPWPLAGHRLKAGSQTSTAASSGQLLWAAILSGQYPKWLGVGGPPLWEEGAQSPCLLWKCGHAPIPEAMGSRGEVPPIFKAFQKSPEKQRRVPVYPFPEPPTQNFTERGEKKILEEHTNVRQCWQNFRGVKWMKACGLRVVSNCSLDGKRPG